MSKIHWAAVAWGLLAATLSGCGGGGAGGTGDSGGTETSYRLGLSPATLAATYVQGNSPQLSVTASLDRQPSQNVSVAIVDTAGVLDPFVQITPGSTNTYLAVLSPKPTLAAGEHSGTLQIRLCLDSLTTCNSQLPGSPFTLPYKFTVKVPPAANVSVESLQIEGSPDELPMPKISTRIPSGSAYGWFTDKGGVFQFPANAERLETMNLDRFLKIDPTLKPGTYTGQIELRVCKEDPCTQELPGSPVVVPYTVKLNASTNLTTLSRTAGVPEWAQHQGNAAHTGYMPMTLDPAKFSRRWRWQPPAGVATGETHELPSGYIAPVVSSSGSVYAMVQGFFQSPTIYALSEHDHGVRWSKADFGNSVINVSPPSVDGSTVYLVSGWNVDAALRGYDVASGTQRFNTSFFATSPRFMAPTLANGDLYTSAGTNNWMVSFRAEQGSYRWGGHVSATDLWTPAVDTKQAYAYMAGGGLHILDVSDGSRVAVIPDPDGFALNNNIYVAPMLTSPGNVIVINRAASTGTRLVSFDTVGRNVRWAMAGSFAGMPAFANGTLYVVNGDKLEARKESDGSLLWSWRPDETATLPFPLDDINQPLASPNVVVTDNIAFVSTSSKVYAVDLSTHKAVWSFPKPGRLALSTSGILYINQPTLGDLPAGLYAINLR
jgi:outer membrane protein assembly factor BamB